MCNCTILAHTFGTAAESEALYVSIQQNKNLFYHFKTKKMNMQHNPLTL